MSNDDQPEIPEINPTPRSPVYPPSQVETDSFPDFDTPAGSDSQQSTMAFNATPAFLGSPDFKVIDIDPAAIAKSLEEYLIRGSKLTGVSLDDIQTGVHILPTDVKKATLVDLLTCGMKLFDALVWLTAGRPTSHPLAVDASVKKESVPSMHEIARSVFYVYFFLITQARYPVRSGTANPPKVPNFLSVVMGMKEDQGVFVDRICSFAPEKFDPHWAEYVNFKNFGQEALSRFGLGVAGYRMFGPFKLYTPISTLTPEQRNAVNFAKKVATAPASWDVHPLTRNPQILTARGNLNKNLGNLILEVFTDEQIEEMVQAKVLYQKPTKEPAYRNYLQWAPEDDISGTRKIFRF
jgi:hypothetical protein